MRADPGTPEASVLGYGERVSVVNAAFANGALVHALNFDALGTDGGHLGVASVVAPLVMAERTGGVNGRDFLAGVAVAAEFTARLAGALSAAEVDANEKFLEGQLLSYLGAAAGAGRILRFTPERMHSAMGLALMQTAGTRQVSFEGGAAKAIYGGFANQGAILSTLLAAQGIDARCDVLEGRAGIYSLFYGGRCDAAYLRGDEFRCVDTVFKPWPTSGLLHPYIEASLALHRPGMPIRSVHVNVTPEAKAWVEPLEERLRPQNAATAANSVFFAVTRTLVNGKLTLADFSPGRLAPLPVPIGYSIAKHASIEVTLQGGEVLTAPVEGKSKPMSYDTLAAKFRDCARHAARPLADRAIEQAIERIANLEQVPDVSILPGLLRGS
jgi:2-methylcitrate dehydratase PrpD